jgi:hypothetical protein
MLTAFRNPSGFNGTAWLNDMYEFVFATKTWREVAARGTVPSARSCPAWAKDDKKIYIHVRVGCLVWMSLILAVGFNRRIEHAIQTRRCPLTRFFSPGRVRRRGKVINSSDECKCEPSTSLSSDSVSQPYQHADSLPHSRRAKEE